MLYDKLCAPTAFNGHESAHEPVDQATAPLPKGHNEGNIVLIW
jgi:hypothetical protein